MIINAKSNLLPDGEILSEVIHKLSQVLCCVLVVEGLTAETDLHSAPVFQVD